MVQHKADVSVAEVAKLTGYSQSIVRHTIDKLRERKILNRQVYMDVYRLGLSYSTLFFSLMPTSKKETNRLVHYLKNSPRVSYFVALGGDFDFCVDICVRETLELLDFMQELSGEFGALFNTKAHQALLSLTDYPVDVVGGGRKCKKTLGFGLSNQKRVVVDQIDHELLSLLSKNPEMESREVAKTLGISNSTLYYRVQRLEKTGVICGYRYLADVSAFGLQSFVHCVYLRGVSKKLRNLLIEFCENTPCITYHLECAGTWDFEFGSSVYTAHEVMSVVHEIQHRFDSAIAKVNTIPLFLYHKVSKYPFPREWSTEAIFGQ
jgi:DNA-binding Lrp family transcriptional regulator